MNRPWPAVFTAVLVALMGLAIAGPTQELRATSTVVLLLFCLCASIVAPLEYAAAGAVACLPVHGFLTQSLGLAENPIPGMNVGCIWSALMLLVFLTRYRNTDFTKSERTLFTLFGLLLLCRALATYRGVEQVFSDYFAIVWGSAQIACAFLWLRHAARILPWSRSRWAGIALGTGPVIVGCSMIPQMLSREILAGTEDLGLARTTGLMDPNYAAVGLVVVLLFLSGKGASSHLAPIRQVFVLFAASVGVLLSGSRTALFALLIAIAILLFRRHKVLPLLGVAGVWGAMIVVNRFAPAIYTRFTNLDSESGLANSRALVFYKAWIAFLEHPLMGSGRETYRFSLGDLAVAHNSLLAFLAEGGILYGAVWLLLVWSLFKTVSHPGREWPSAGYTAMAIVAAYFAGSNGILIDGMDYVSILVAGYAGCFLGGSQLGPVPRRCLRRCMAHASPGSSLTADPGYPPMQGHQLLPEGQ